MTFDASNGQEFERMDSQQQGSATGTRWWRRRWVQVVAGVALLGVVAAASFVAYVAHNTEPIMRKRLVETLAARFNSPVELDHLDISVIRGLEVRGSGLRILYLAGPTQPDAHPQGAAPMLSVAQFNFRTSLRSLFHARTRIAVVQVNGLELHIPPAGQRAGMFGQPADVEHPKPPTQPKIALVVDQIDVTNMRLYIETSKPGKEPLEFDIANVNLRDVGSDSPLLYDANVRNPKPVGDVHAVGHFGPWNGAEPRTTAIDGDYTFDHADLNTIKGISGILSSTGHFAGQLGTITVDGTTETPDFALDLSDHPVPLHTEFHAIVDGTTGDTTLAPVHARLLKTEFTCEGMVARVKGKGHDIALTVDMPHGRIEDVLQLGMKSQPPVMRAGVSMHAKLHIPPGKERVAAKLQLAGILTEHSITFTNPKVQDRMDSLSMRAQGMPEEAKDAGADRKAETASELKTSFSLDRGMMTFSQVDYRLPGATVLLDGVYSMDGNTFEFKGHVRTDATASQMVTGWKSLLLKPVDRFLKKDGAGLQLPISISGTKSDVHFGLAMHGSAEESTKDMAADVKARRAAEKAARR